MSLLIEPRHHRRFRSVLEDSFRLRREVFVDGLGWDLPHAHRTAETGLEYDDFDGDAATYLANLNAVGQVMASVRITPSTQPNLACDSLARRMGIVMPRGPHIVEMSRMCADPRLSREERRQTMLELRACVGLLFMRNGWTHSVGVGYDHHIQPFIRSGMTVEILGPPVVFPGDSEPSFAILATDPDRPARVARMLAGRPACLQDPDKDSSLFARFGGRRAA
ncbi:MAG: acyl-homoserine-lactone synthase [Caulobacteraceae bacterium]